MVMDSITRKALIVFFADGSVISEKQNDFVIAEVDMERLAQFRTHYQFLSDADDFTLEI
ncbi:hypothetical protein BPO_1551 [Bergeyella porcorum]|uniref:Uncharacterized protein n=1 Tax=Bergeyella porcorum TaxID=1735111 RepID=A0AAU0F310_9FLAO